MLDRALNYNQQLILTEVSCNSGLTISALLRKMEKRDKISISTLKLNAKILRELELIEFGDFRVARLTDLGFLVKEIGGDGIEIC